MPELIFVKLGGSLITDKNLRYSIRRDVLLRISHEIAAARTAKPDLRLLIGHGSGSFGHVAAKESGFDPVQGPPSVQAFAAVSAAAAALNATVRAALLGEGVPAVSLAPSASFFVAEGTPQEFAVRPFQYLLEWGAVPLTFGDVAMSDQGGTIIATEVVFRALAPVLQPQRILLIGEVEGVYPEDPRHTEQTSPPIRQITPQTWPTLQTTLGGSHGTDVTGGMAAKVKDALALAAAVPGLEVRIASGMRAGLLEQLLLGKAPQAGTTIRA